MKKLAAFCFPVLTSGLLALALTGCNQDPKTGAAAETSTSGSIKISADESFQPIIGAQLDVFHKLYKNATVKAAYKTEQEVVNDLLEDSARLAIIARPLSDSELETLSRNSKISKQGIKTTRIAYDGIALIQTSAILPSCSITIIRVRPVSCRIPLPTGSLSRPIPLLLNLYRRW